MLPTSATNMLIFLKWNFLLLLLSVTVTRGQRQSCGETQASADRGFIRLPDLEQFDEYDDELDCFWNFTAPPGMKLLAKVDLVQLPPPDVQNSSLQLVIDGQSYEVPRNCVKCTSELLGGSNVQVSFILRNYSAFNDTILPRSLGNFQIRLKSFDPTICDKPTTPVNGYIIGKEWNVGKEILFYCNPPYDLVGSSISRCVISRDGSSLTPSWSSPPPTCVMRDCSHGPIHRTAGVGAIASPGYPGSSKSPATSCQWEITAKPGQQIRASLSYLHFPNRDNPLYFEQPTSLKLALYDGNVTNPIANLTSTITTEAMNFTTWTNKLIVHFFAENGPPDMPQDQMGFYLEYSAVPGFCSDPGPPLNGEMVAYSFSLGSTIVYRCSQGFTLIGEHHSECLPTGNWSNPKPVCKLNFESPVPLVASNASETITTSDVMPHPKVSKGKHKNFPSTKPPVEKFKLPFFAKDMANQTGGPEKHSPPDPPWFSDVNNMTTDRVKSRKEDEFESLMNSNRNIWNPLDKPRKAKEQPESSRVPLQPDKDEEGLEGVEEDDDDPSLELDPSPRPILPSGDDLPTTRQPGANFLVVAAIAGLGAPLGVATLLLVALVVYRRRYPVRMRFGRKFSTFENPVYAQHPRELSRLSSPATSEN